MEHNKWIFLLLFGCFWVSCEVQSNSYQESIEENASLEDTIAWDTSIQIMHLLGKFNPKEDTQFVRIEDMYSAGSARGAFMHKEAYAEFVKMYDAAKADGIKLTIRSATRNFEYQKGIWERKWKGVQKVGGKDLSKSTKDPVERAQTILRYSSMPGTSRHHWGTDIDINSFQNAYFESGKGLREYEWLQQNAARFGFCQPYTVKGSARPYGYEEEKWHWSYMPVAKKYLIAYEAVCTLDSIYGFDGDEAADSLNVIKHYVSGVSPVCK